MAGESRSGSFVLALHGVWPDADELEHRIWRIVRALLKSEDYSMARDVLRALPIAEGKIWELIEEFADRNGDDPGEVWEQLYAPALGEE